MDKAYESVVLSPFNQAKTDALLNPQNCQYFANGQDMDAPNPSAGWANDPKNMKIEITGFSCPVEWTSVTSSHLSDVAGHLITQREAHSQQQGQIQITAMTKTSRTSDPNDFSGQSMQIFNDSVYNMQSPIQAEIRLSFRYADRKANPTCTLNGETMTDAKMKRVGISTGN